MSSNATASRRSVFDFFIRFMRTESGSRFNFRSFARTFFCADRDSLFLTPPRFDLR